MKSQLLLFTELNMKFIIIEERSFNFMKILPQEMPIAESTYSQKMKVQGYKIKATSCLGLEFKRSKVTVDGSQQMGILLSYILYPIKMMKFGYFQYLLWLKVCCSEIWGTVP